MDTLLVQLDRDHPGFRDLQYRERRDTIARIALDHRPGDPVPQAPYTDEEHTVWRTIFDTLGPLHEEWVCQEMNAVQADLALDRNRIPQLSAVNRVLASTSGFQMEPVAGLVSPRFFLERLAESIFLSTQYIRHYSRPLYTPEPDVVHELVGHAATLLHPGVVSLSRGFGHAAKKADEETIQALIRVYWYTLEFGALEESGRIKAYGAGLLSSAGELARFAEQAELRAWDIDRIAQTEFDPTDYQPQIYVAPSFQRMVSELEEWLHGLSG